MSVFRDGLRREQKRKVLERSESMAIFEHAVTEGMFDLTVEECVSWCRPISQRRQSSQRPPWASTRTLRPRAPLSATMSAKHPPSSPFSVASATSRSASSYACGRRKYITLEVKVVGMWRYVTFLRFKQPAFQRRKGSEISSMRIKCEGELFTRNTNIACMGFDAFFGHIAFVGVSHAEIDLEVRVALR